MKNVEERTVLEGPDSLMRVRHQTLRGTNFEIGQALAAQAIERYGRTLADLEAEPLYARVRRGYFQRTYPIHWERMRGTAAAFGAEPDDDRYDFSALPYLLDVGPEVPGCSVVYYPPSTTVTGNGYLSRNYDFSTGTLADLMQIPVSPRLEDRARPVMSEPYIMEWHPEDGGYASLAIHAFDILSGTLDGMNSAGLVVSIMADEEAIADLGVGIERHPFTPRAIGLHELQLMRYLLDTCATVGEAKEALLTVKQYYFFVPCHYIVADQSGRSFVYENSTGRNVQYVIDGGGRPQVVTNFQMHRHPDQSSMGADELTLETNAFWRYRKLAARIAEHDGRFGVEDMRANNACVNIQSLLEVLKPAPGGRNIAANLRARTLWHSLYNQHKRTAEFSFYLGESGDIDGTCAERRTQYLKFTLEGASDSAHGTDIGANTPRSC